MASGSAHEDVERAERGRVQAGEVAWALREANRRAAGVDQVLARRLGLKPTDYAAISHVMTAAAPLGPHDLSERLGISTGSTSELLDRLERAGHLRRERHLTDRRRVSLHVSDAAVGRILAELSTLFAATDRLAEDFSVDEQAVIVRYLRSAAQLMRDFAGDETP